jgi:hypothetical protein
MKAIQKLSVKSMSICTRQRRRLRS